MSSTDLTQSRITRTGADSYGGLLELFDAADGAEVCDGACVSLIGATHIAEIEQWGTALGPRYIVSLSRLLEMTHFADDLRRVRREWESADAFTDLADAQKYYAELVTSGVARWVERLNRLD